MSVIFKKISYRNFLSVGNVPVEIDLNSHKATALVGKNGHGKSVILDALTFSLFGKPFRNVSKTQLINSINLKHCEVIVEFDVNGHQYKVRRGQKPVVFEIFCDGELINQDAALKDYQKVLEQQILKMNFRTFTQVVILGSATYVPFMQLPAQQRREVIEEILDIRVFSVMNQILKERVSAVKDQLQGIEKDIAHQRNAIAAQKKLIETIETSRKAQVASLQQRLDANNATIAEHQQKVAALSDQISQHHQRHEKLSQATDALSTASKMRVKLTTTMDAFAKDVDFFHNNHTCPSCQQNIDPTHKAHVVEAYTTKINVHKDKITTLEQTIEKLQAQADKSKQLLSTLHDLSIQMSTHNQTISLLTEQNVQLQHDMASVEGDSHNVDAEKQKMRLLAENAIRLVEKKTELLDQKQLQDVASALLKDTGIKTAIIREYLPVMNKLINRYLDAMDLYASFELDESFNEVIRSRNRDTFTYASFSEGEKQRINISILLTWRQIAKMKNSLSTNLLVMDEVLDSSLDVNGMETVLNLINDMEQTNIIIISHREATSSHIFDRVLTAVKRGDFSTISENSSLESIS